MPEAKADEAQGGPSPAAPRYPGIKEWLLPRVAAGFIRALRATLRLRHHGDEELRAWERAGTQFILAFWHRHLLLMPYAYRGRRIAVLISASRDGERIARTVARFGIDAARGSSSRGGAAGMRDLLRRTRNGWDIAFTPDGPRGPACKVQPGVVLAAALTGLPVVPVGYDATRGRRLRSWDGFLVPLPGARVDFVYGRAVCIGRDDDLTARGAELEAALLAVQERAATLAAG
jgi:lysophospholipid acyltransferase (LPLAT)-like uncharacterized protein